METRRYLIPETNRETWLELNDRMVYEHVADRDGSNTYQSFRMEIPKGALVSGFWDTVAKDFHYDHSLAPY